MTYDTINDEESTPLKIQGGYSDDATGVAPSSTKKPTSSTIVRALMVTTAVGALLLMADPSKMMTTMNKSSNVDGMVVVSSTETSNDDFYECHVPPYEEAFSGLSCKNGGDTQRNKDGYCAGGGESFGAHPAMMHYETCYVSQNGYCWSRSYKKTISCNGWLNLCTYGYYRCDPQGYSDGSDGYDKDGFWHVTAPRSDGSCGRPCRKFSSYDGH